MNNNYLNNHIEYSVKRTDSALKKRKAIENRLACLCKSRQLKSSLMDDIDQYAQLAVADCIGLDGKIDINDLIGQHGR